MLAAAIPAPSPPITPASSSTMTARSRRSPTPPCRFRWVPPQRKRCASAPVDAPRLLGTAAHPTLNIVYAGLPSANEIGVFQYDETGQLSFVASVPDQGSAACWCVVSADGNFLYVATTGTDSIGVFSL